jgi:transcription elongation GreA/GreB family factor
VEARLDDGWISTESPLGSSLLGSRLGEAVIVATPGGPVRHEVLGIERGT